MTTLDNEECTKTTTFNGLISFIYDKEHRLIKDSVFSVRLTELLVLSCSVSLIETAS